MTLEALVTSYLTVKRAAGMRFDSEASLLKAFCRAMGDIELAEVTPHKVRAFLAGPRPITTYWHHKYTVLGGLYRFALSRGYLVASPLPTIVPKCPPSLTPYIYSIAELRRLLAATERLATPMSPLQALTFRTLLLLLYGTGMRVSEALALTLNDMELGEQLITVRDTKFFKTRWVPLGPKLTAQLAVYTAQRRRLPLPREEASPLLATRTGHRLHYDQVNRLFCRVRQEAGVHREAHARYQPRLHDLRHTAIVHRVVAWYRAGLDVQRWLLPLSTYVGHSEIKSTQRYLSMTPELLTEASQRFARYAQREDDHEI
jgi:integrase/recombinase XerD